MNGLVQIFRGLGPIRLAAIGAVMLGVIGFFAYLMGQSTQGNLSVLYSQVDPADGAKIVQKLELLDVPFQISPDGSMISVPGDKVARLRMELAQEGLPSGGGIGYEIFDRGDILSTSGSMIDINKLRALEGELAKSIKTISGVSSARVHLVVPKRELFSKEKSEPSASIVLKMKGALKLSPTQVQAIQQLVSSGVPGLPADRIAVIDDKGNLLAKNQEGDGLAQAMVLQQEARVAYEAKTSKQLEALIERTVGMGKVRVEVAADIDFDQVTSNSEKYDPDGQVVRSTTNSNEDGKTESADGSVSVQNAIPQDQAQGGAGKNTNSNKRNEENISYEISRTVETHKKEGGSIKNISVAVLVDGNYTKDKAGKETYAPRSKEEIEQIKMLVKTAIGFKDDRGDKVEIVNMQFAHPDLEEVKPEETKGFIPQMDLTRVIELLVLAAVGILILIMIVRPVLLRVIESSGVANLDAEAAALLTSATGQSYAALPDFSSAANASAAMPGYTPPAGIAGADISLPVDDTEDDSMIDIANLDGRLKASSLKKISEIIDKHPEEAVTIIRNWMYDEPWKQEKTI